MFEDQHGSVVTFFRSCACRRVVDVTIFTCGSRTAVGVLSLACPRESTQREDTPSRCAAQHQRGALCSSPLPDARPTRRARKPRASGSNTVERNPPGAAAVLGLLYGGFNCNDNGNCNGVGFRCAHPNLGGLPRCRGGSSAFAITDCSGPLRRRRDWPSHARRLTWRHRTPS